VSEKRSRRGDQRSTDGDKQSLSLVGARCCAERADGEPCEAWAVEGGDRCVSHSERLRDRMQTARRLGGLHRRRKVHADSHTRAPNLGTTQGIVRLLQQATEAALACDTSLAQARTLASIALAAARVVELRELEDRIDALESRAASSGW
jgi:hypothetical protein